MKTQKHKQRGTRHRKHRNKTPSKKRGGCGCSKTPFFNGGSTFLGPTNPPFNSSTIIPFNTYSNDPFVQLSSRLDPQLATTPVSIGGGRRKKGKRNTRRGRKMKGGADIFGAISGIANSMVYNGYPFSANTNLLNTAGDSNGVSTGLAAMSGNTINDNQIPVQMRTPQPLV